MMTRWWPILVTLCLLLTQMTLPADEPSFDLVLRGGKIVDGTGNPWRWGDVAVRGDRIAAVGRIPAGSAKRELDVSGLVVAPGFIDIHSHSDYLLLEDGQALSKVHQGVTTEVLGEGSSAGPHRGPLPLATSTDKAGRFATLARYFDAVEKSGAAVNVASYVGLDNLWRSVMGASFDRPTAAQLDEMKLLLDEALRDGGAGAIDHVGNASRIIGDDRRSRWLLPSRRTARRYLLDTHSQRRNGRDRCRQRSN